MLKQSNKVESNQPNKIEFECVWNNNTNAGSTIFYLL